MATSPIYPGHELLYDDPVGSVVELHAPGFLGTHAQRVAFVTAGLTVSKQWYETDTNLCYQWTGSVWQLIGTGGFVTTVTGVAPIVSSGGFTPAISVNPVTTSVAGVVPAGTNLVLENVFLSGKSFGGGNLESATVTAGIATITHAGHTYLTGDSIIFVGATSSGSIGDFNQLHTILTSNQGAGTYTFATTATGTISTPSEIFWFSGSRSLNAVLVGNITRSTAGKFVLTFKNSQPDIFYGIRPGMCFDAAAQNLIFESDNTNTKTVNGFGFFTISEGSTAADPLTAFDIGFIGII